MMNKAGRKGPVIILIKDTDGNLFGGFYSCELKFVVNKFQGTGESFLFKFDKVFFLYNNNNREQVNYNTGQLH